MSNTEQDLAALRDDFNALRGDVATLVAHLTANATNGAKNTASQIDDAAGKLIKDVTAGGEQSLKAIGQQIEEQPVIALLIALGIGYIGGRVLTR